jgi:enterochelin esterase-like enzyme
MFLDGHNFVNKQNIQNFLEQWCHSEEFTNDERANKRNKDLNNQSAFHVMVT